MHAAGIQAPRNAPAGADAGPDVEEIGVPDPQVTTEIEVRACVNVKRAVLACYASQLGPEHFLMRTPPDLFD